MASSPPVSMPMRELSPACRRTIAAICSGTVGHWPRHSLRPALSTMQMAVIFCETSKPTKWVIMAEPPMLRITGRCRPDRGTIGRSGAHRDYRMSTYDFRKARDLLKLKWHLALATVCFLLLRRC